MDTNLVISDLKRSDNLRGKIISFQTEHTQTQSLYVVLYLWKLLQDIPYFESREMAHVLAFFWFSNPLYGPLSSFLSGWVAKWHESSQGWFSQQIKEGAARAGKGGVTLFLE